MLAYVRVFTFMCVRERIVGKGQLDCHLWHSNAHTHLKYTHTRVCKYSTEKAGWDWSNNCKSLVHVALLTCTCQTHTRTHIHTHTHRAP